MRRRPTAGGGELGLLFDEEKAAALGAGEARRWRSNGSHASIGRGESRRFGRERGPAILFRGAKLNLVFQVIFFVRPGGEV